MPTRQVIKSPLLLSFNMVNTPVANGKTPQPEEKQQFRA
jgi:hypothetical protein